MWKNISLVLAGLLCGVGLSLGTGNSESVGTIGERMEIPFTPSMGFGYDSVEQDFSPAIQPGVEHPAPISPKMPDMALSQKELLRPVGQREEYVPLVLAHYRIETKHFSVDSGKSGTDTASCPKGFDVLGGGAKGNFFTPGGHYQIRASYPSSPNNIAGWTVTIGNFQPITAPVSVYAICAKQIKLNS